jgi:hypothetical protein
MKYKVGDKVLVKNRFDIRSSIPTRVVTSEMISFCDKVVTIESIGNDFYRVEEDRDNFCWDDGMFIDRLSPIDREEVKYLYVGKYGEFLVIIKDGNLQSDFFSSIEEIKKLYGNNYTVVKCL